jgi:hypothetical protein
MIIGEILHEEPYDDVFYDLLKPIENNFQNVESGIQGDAYIWIFENGEKVSLDTFTSLRFQLKSQQSRGFLTEQVLSIIKTQFKFYIY